MPRFSANLSLLFSEFPFLERIPAAKRCGFPAVEIQFPYEAPALTIKSAIDQAGLELVLFNVPAGDLMNGGEGLAAVPEKRAQFVAAVDTAKQYAEVLHPRIINVLPGRCLRKDRSARYLEMFRQNLAYTADVFATQGIKVVFEAVNTRDMPGFLVSSGAQMVEILDGLNHPNVFMQYDLYHMQTMGENIIDFFHRYAARIGHVQFADAPGRGQPGTGAIDFEQLFGAIDRSGYRGWVGAEYRPTVATSASLHWLSRYR
jgi:hydroxypyruvate isomerase